MDYSLQFDVAASMFHLLDLCAFLRHYCDDKCCVSYFSPCSESAHQLLLLLLETPPTIDFTHR